MSEHTPEQKATEIWDKICEFSFQKSDKLWGKDYSEYIRNNEPTKTLLAQERDFAERLIASEITALRAQVEMMIDALAELSHLKGSWDGERYSISEYDVWRITDAALATTGKEV